MKITPEKPIDTIYIEQLQEISEITGDSLDETMKNAIAIYWLDWKNKGLLQRNYDITK